MWVLRTLCVVAVLCVGTSVSASSVKVGDRAPVFTLKALNPEVAGSTYINLGKLVGGKAKEAKKGVLLSFFATYCEPCKKEMPYLAKLYEQFRDEGFSIILISIDEEKDKIEEARQLAAQSGITFPVVSDRFNIVAKRYKISQLPTVYFVDGLGQIVMAKTGYSQDISKELLVGVRQVLGKPTAAPVPESLRSYFSEDEARGESGSPKAGALPAK